MINFDQSAGEVHDMTLLAALHCVNAHSLGQQLKGAFDARVIFAKEIVALEIPFLGFFLLS
jgi:hypothetical protein